MGFTPALGVGQGSITSQLIWRCLIDIFLRTLESFTDADIRDWAHVSGPLGPTTGMDQCYVNNLLPTSANMEGMQTTANVLSGYCMVSGLRLSLPKIRHTIINTHKGLKFPLDLHMGTCTTVQRLPEVIGEEIKNLRAQYDAHNSGRSEFDCTPGSRST